MESWKQLYRFGFLYQDEVLNFIYSLKRGLSIKYKQAKLGPPGSFGNTSILNLIYKHQSPLNTYECKA